MKLLLPVAIVRKLRHELRGRRHEIGGILVGESIGADIFRLTEISVQHTGGTVAHFVRDPGFHRTFLADFFRRTGNDFTRFNYIGEWHSHPAFEPVPSGEDVRTMFDIVEDPDVGANFAVLVIIRLGGRRILQLSGTLFRAGLPPEAIDVVIERRDGLGVGRSLLKRVREWLRLT